MHTLSILISLLLCQSLFAQKLQTSNELHLMEINKQHLINQDEKSYFSSIYLIITKSINRQIRLNNFNRPECIEMMKEQFLKMYFRALENNEKTPTPWKEAFKFKGKSTTHLLLGMNAHITYDLPISLYTVSRINPNCTLENIREDYFSLNKLFTSLTPKLNSELKKVAKHIDYKKSLLQEAKEQMVSRLVINLRKNAWENFRKLNSEITNKNYQKVRWQIELSSYNRALRYKSLNILLPMAGY